MNRYIIEVGVDSNTFDDENDMEDNDDLSVKDYTWTQTAKDVHIRIPIKQVSHDSVDLFSTDSYLKAHFNPFLFEVFLLHDVDISKSKSLVKDDMIIFNLHKRDETEWVQLEKELTKAEKMELKYKILDKNIEEAQKEAEDRRVKKSEMDRFAVQRAMDIDNKQHELMDSRRDAERKKAMDDLEKWRVESADETNKKNALKDVPLMSSNKEPIMGACGDVRQKCTITELSSSEEDEKPKSRSAKPAKKAAIKKLVKSEYVERKKVEVAKRVLPKMRATAELKITHTPRTFPTPSRESAAHEEEAWLKNITMARRATGFVSEDLRPEEQDPQWCKDKGDEFFRAGNFLGAISAYTHGIKLSDKLHSLYANRAATHFALGNFNKCISDCSTALDLMKPACEGNRKSRAKCIARRAAALARVGYLSKAIDEMKAASKLLPDDEVIKKDIFDMERAWEQNPDSE